MIIQLPRIFCGQSLRCLLSTQIKILDICIQHHNCHSLNLLLLLGVFLRHRKSCVVRHRIQMLLRRDWLPLLHVCSQQLEVVDVIRRSVCVEELGLLVSRVAECMRRPNGNRDIVALFRIDGVLGAIGLRDMVSNSAFGRQKRLVVHLVPMGWRSFQPGRESELSGTDTIVYKRRLYG